jgi:hypothetical protein
LCGPEFDPKTPSIARVYDYLLGGKDDFAADREAGDRLIAVFPAVVEAARENRQFLARAVTWVANQGVGQFIDLGCGMPTAPNTHETAQAIRPDARVVHVDNDPIAVSRLRKVAVRASAASADRGPRPTGERPARPTTPAYLTEMPGCGRILKTCGQAPGPA